MKLGPGDPAPWFRAATPSRDSYNFDSAAGRYLLLCFFGPGKNEHASKAMDEIVKNRDMFDDKKVSFFGVTIVQTESDVSPKEYLPGIHHFLDLKGDIHRLYGAISEDRTESRVILQWILVDPTLRVMKVVPFAPDGSSTRRILDLIHQLPDPARAWGIELQAPILFLPNVFEPQLCSKLIELYDTAGGEESGFMREVDGKTIGVYDRKFKSRKDYYVNDSDVYGAIQRRIVRRVVPEIAKAHQFHVTRMERYLVGCYAAADGGHFMPHRDNTTKGTAHRRFAVSVNLNDDFEGGEVWFPEYGPRAFKAPVGGAVVFSCSLLHAVTPVTKGRRYAFLPFLYDDSAAEVRRANSSSLA